MSFPLLCLKCSYRYAPFPNLIINPFKTRAMSDGSFLIPEHQPNATAIIRVGHGLIDRKLSMPTKTLFLLSSLKGPFVCYDISFTWCLFPECLTSQCVQAPNTLCNVLKSTQLILPNGLDFKARLLPQRKAAESWLKSLCFCLEKYFYVMATTENLILVASPYSNFGRIEGGELWRETWIEWTWKDCKAKVHQNSSPYSV